MHKLIRLLIFMVFISGASAQNSVHLTNLDGIQFRVFREDSAVNIQPQADVIIRNVHEDTLTLTLRSGSLSNTVQLFLLDKGRTVNKREFFFQVVTRENKLLAKFASMHEHSGELLDIASPPKIDSSFKVKEGKFGRFAELKNGKVSLFKNIPEAGCDSAMSDDYLSYAKLLLSYGKVEDEKIRLAEDIVQNNCLSISQLQYLVETIPYELDRVKLVRKAAPQVVDRQNYKKLQKSFRIESAFRQAEEILTKKPKKEPGSRDTCTVTDSEATILEVTGKLRTADNDGERLQILRKQRICLNLPHVRDLLKTFIHDRDRLEAARILYYQTTGRTGFGELADEFTYPQTVEEFREFVREESR